MNERIRHLAILCSEECGDYHIGSNPQFNHEKFAELSVRECILIIQKGISLDGNTTEKFLRTMKHLKDIKEHFGIEE